MKSTQIHNDFQTVARCVQTHTQESFFEASRMIMPLIISLKEFLEETDLHTFYNVISSIYNELSNLETKEIVSTVSTQVITPLFVHNKLTVDQETINFFSLLSYRHVTRTLLYLFFTIASSPHNKAIVYQNLRMGGMFPPMEPPVTTLLARKGFPVFEIPAECLDVTQQSVHDRQKVLQTIRNSYEFKESRLLLTRFKISSAETPDDSHHPTSFIPLNEQHIKLKALQELSQIPDCSSATRNIPILMIDGSKNQLSLAQEYVRPYGFSLFNAIDCMSFPFYAHHLYWIESYGFDNIEELLPASSAAFNDGKWYYAYALRIASMLEKDLSFWKTTRKKINA